jgi:LmbE family N-acetylglucosaminyl deacetylase
MTSRTPPLKVLAVFAHPDDEGFGSGGTLAMLAVQGARITLVCATNGDVGEISDPGLATPATLAQVRQEELRQAMTITGVGDVRFLNYRDSGMAGTADNQHPNSLHQAPGDKVVEQLTDIIREVRPDLMMTHDPSGGYGHPDHKAVCRHTTTAWEASASNDGGGPGQAALYYASFPRSAFRRMWQEMLDLGISPPFASLDIESLGTPDEEVTTVVDVTARVDTKIASLNCHRTQLDPNGPFAQLPEEKNREYMSVEYFTLVAPSTGEHQREMPDDILKTLAGEFNAG